jgi:3alpha(or 20beta)-hydroxysteroid dehydrogenase
MYNGGTEGTRHIALDRIGEPSEVSNLIVYLASDESSYSTGAEFLVDGGETAGMAANLPK